MHALFVPFYVYVCNPLCLATTIVPCLCGTSYAFACTFVKMAPYISYRLVVGLVHF